MCCTVQVFLQLIPVNYSLFVLIFLVDGAGKEVTPINTVGDRIIHIGVPGDVSVRKLSLLRCYTCICSFLVLGLTYFVCLCCVVLLCYVVYIALCCVVLCCVLCCVVLCCVVLCCVVLCCVVLCCVVLCCVVLCCVVFVYEA